MSDGQKQVVRVENPKGFAGAVQSSILWARREGVVSVQIRKSSEGETGSTQIVVDFLAEEEGDDGRSREYVVYSLVCAATEASCEAYMHAIGWALLDKGWLRTTDPTQFHMPTEVDKAVAL